MTAYCIRESGIVGRLEVLPRRTYSKDYIAADILRGLNAMVKKDKFIKVIVI